MAQTIDSGAPTVAAPILHWVMVTAFENADGSRLVMTNEGVSAAARRAAMMPRSDEAPVAAQQDAESTQPASPNSRQTAPASQRQQSSQQPFPYAVVPVRGGWLIVQM